MTLRKFVLQQSTLPTGNTVRDHINNPAEIGGGENIVVKDLDGTLIIPVMLEGTIFPIEIVGLITEIDNIVGRIDTNEIKGIIEKDDIEGEVCE